MGITELLHMLLERRLDVWIFEDITFISLLAKVLLKIYLRSVISWINPRENILIRPNLVR